MLTAQIYLRVASTECSSTVNPGAVNLTLNQNVTETTLAYQTWVGTGQEKGREEMNGAGKGGKGQQKGWVIQAQEGTGVVAKLYEESWAAFWTISTCRGIARGCS